MRELARTLSLLDFQRRIGPFGLVRHSIETLEALPAEDGDKTRIIDLDELIGKVMLLAVESSKEQVVTLTRPEPGAEISVGRHADQDLVIEDLSVSKRHAVLQWSGTQQGCQVRDLGSTNGTFVNALRLETDPLTLRDGDIVSFGDVAYSFQLAESIYRRLADGTTQPVRQPEPPPQPSKPGARIGAMSLRKTVPRPPRAATSSRPPPSDR